MLLLLHGALGARQQFAPLQAALGDIPSTAIDFEGHGERPASRPFAIDHFVDNVAEHLDASGTERVALFGYSMGGYVALRFAARFPHRASTVFTLGTKLAWTPEVAARETRQLDAETIAAKVPKFASALESRHTGIGWRNVLEETAQLLGALGTQPLLTEQTFQALQCPVRFAIGDRDMTVTLEETRDAARLTPNGELEVLPATAHPIERVSAGRLAWSIREFSLS